MVPPGRGLLIADGLGLATASLLGGAATYAAVRVDRATSAYGGLAETANGQGYTTPDADTMRRELETDGPLWRRVRIGTFSGLSGAAMEVRGNLTISGGWTASCASRSETGITTIAGTPAQVA